MKYDEMKIKRTGYKLVQNLANNKCEVKIS